MCATFTIERLEAQYRSASGEWVTFWDLAGELPVSAGSSFDAQELSTQVEGDISQPGFEPGGSVTVDVTSTASSRSYLGVFDLDEDSGAGQWLHSDGTQTSSAC